MCGKRAATLLGSGEPWKKVDYLKAFNWLTFYGGKFSTSQGRGVFMHDALELLPADTWRYFLLANAPESSDADFTWELLANAVNKDLAGTFGNFVNRLLRFTKSKFGDEVPGGGVPGDAEHSLVGELNMAVARFTEHFEELQFRKSMQELRHVWSVGNVYLDQAAPWQTIKEDRDAAALAVRTSFGLVRLFSQLSAPVMPDIVASVLESVGEPAELSWPEEVSEIVLGFPVGQQFCVPDVLFAKLTDEEIAAWTYRFGGRRDEVRD